MTIVVTTEEDLRRIVRKEVQKVIDGLTGVRASVAEPLPVLLTVSDVASRCAVTPTTVRAWIHSGDLAAQRAGRRYLVRPPDLDAFLAYASAHAQPDAEKHLSMILSRIEKVRTR